jgi:hypothetical protein
MDPKDAQDSAPWTSLYLALAKGNRSIPKCTSMMRIQLSKDRMFEHRVDIVDVAIGIELFTKGNVIAIPSSTMKGIVDVYPNDAFIKKSKDFENMLSVNSDQISQTYLVTVISSYIAKDEIFISGIRDITSYTPSFLDITGIIKSSVVIDESKNLYRIYFDSSMIYKNGIPSMKIVKIIERYIGKILGYSVAFDIFEITKNLDTFPMPKITEIPEDYKFSTQDYKTLDSKVLKYVVVKSANKINIPISKYLGEIYSKLQTEEKKTGVESIDICEFRHYYALIEGNNFEDVITVPGVDLTRTYSNDFYKTLDLLGVEAVKNLLYIEGNLTLDSIGEYLTRSHLNLIVTGMLHYGFPVGTTYINMKKTGVFRPITLSSSQRAYENLTLGALYNVEENMAASVSAAISVGLKIPVGTGMRNVEIISREPLVESDMRARDYSAQVPQRSDMPLIEQKQEREGKESDILPRPMDVKSPAGVLQPSISLNISDQITPPLESVEKKISVENDVLRYGERVVEYEESQADENVRDVVEKMRRITEAEYLLENEMDPSGLNIKLDYVF